MIESEREEFCRLLSGLAEYYGRPLSAEAMGVYWGALRDRDIACIRAAAERHVRDPEAGKYMPRASDLIGQIADGHLGADEAWALCPMSEAETAIWTDEIRQAFLGAALPLIEEGDRIAARMAFRDSYHRHLAEARAIGRPARWVVSLGHDKAGREAPIRTAIEQGRITAGVALAYLPAPVERIGATPGATAALAQLRELTAGLDRT